MPSHAEQLEGFLADQDISCPSCDYNLRGLRGDFCPECNQKLALRVSLAEPRQALFITGLVGLAAGLGFHGLLFIYFLVRFLPRGAPPDWPEFLMLTGTFMLIEGVGLAFWIKNRRRFLRLEKRTKVWLVGGAWVVTFAGLALFSVIVR